MAAELLEVDAVYVGEAEEDSATTSLTTLTRARIWTDSCAILSIPMNPTIEEESPVFACTLRVQDENFSFKAMRNFNPHRGVAGGWVTKVGVTEVIQSISPISGHYISNCAA